MGNGDQRGRHRFPTVELDGPIEEGQSGTRDDARGLRHDQFQIVTQTGADAAQLQAGDAGQNLELQAGMTLALEPKLIFPGKGVIGLENSHVVTKEGLEQLNSFSEEITVI